tara:strand:+ start:58 stop:279 length:222 start_codon:yes stop_codon:yes gene_type:complete
MNEHMITHEEIVEIINTYYDGNMTNAIALLLKNREDKPLTIAAAMASVLAAMDTDTARSFAYSLKFRAESHEG